MTLRGDPIAGEFEASDLNFGHFALQTSRHPSATTEPGARHASAAELPNPAAWTLKTAGLQLCGYVSGSGVDVHDRTYLVQTTPLNSHNHDADDTGRLRAKVV